MPTIADLVQQAEDGDPKAAETLFVEVYNELRRLAAGKLAGERAAQTLQATALVHEAWLRLGGDAQPEWRSRAHFFGSAAEAMRRILIDRARSRLAQRHGGGLERVNIDDVVIPGLEEDSRLVAVSEALDRLARIDAPKAELVKLRHFVGLSVEESAAVLGISEPTAKRWWAYARAWLAAELKETQKSGG